VVLVLTTGADKCPTALLFLEIETGRVWQEDQSDEEPGETEPWDDVETRANIDVVVKDGGSQSTQFADSS